MWADKPRKLLPSGSEGLLQAQPSDGQAQAKSFDSSCIPRTQTESFWKEEREGGREIEGRKDCASFPQTCMSMYHVPDTILGARI